MTRVLVTAVLILGTSVAAAQAPSESEKRARAHYERGLTLYDLSKWDESIAEFKKAYQLLQAPAFIFNIAQAYRLKGDAEQAIENYRLYLRLDPKAPNKADVEAHIANLEKGRRDAQPLPPPPEPAPEGRPATRAAPDRVLRVDANVMRVEVKGQGRSRTGMLRAGLITAGAGLAVGGIGVYYAVKARSEWDDVEAVVDRDGPWTPEAHQTWQDAEDHERLSQILIGVGTVAFITGSVLTVFGTSAADPLFSVAPAPGGATFVVRGGF